MSLFVEGESTLRLPPPRVQEARDTPGEVLDPNVWRRDGMCIDDSVRGPDGAEGASNPYPGASRCLKGNSRSTAADHLPFLSLSNARSS